uniref:Isobutyryl-CoA dehydrogenase, mitochondrial n=1 Tax=Panagrellus redivivus TaxID=6233 RepID=A0A7E4W5L5_PANRE
MVINDKFVVKMALRKLFTVSRGGLNMARGIHSYVCDPSIGLNPEQQEIQTVARDFARNELYPKMAEFDQKEEMPKETLKLAGEVGFGAIYCHEEHGGSGLTRFDAALIFEQLATGCTSTAAYISIHNMVAWMIDTYGSEAHKKKFLPGMAAFTLRGSYALTEPDSGSDAASLRTTARRDGDHFVINGSKAFISGSGDSHVYAVMVRHEGKPGPKGIFCILIEPDTPGFILGKKEKKLGWNTHAARIITFEDVRVPVSNVIGGEDQGFNIAMSGLNGGRLNIAACSLGAAQQSFDLALEHLKVRKQFGKALADFQWNQFKAAEMATKLVTSRLAVREAARHLTDNTQHKVAMCALAKLYATDTCFEIVNQALQMHGGYGILKDYPLQQFLRDSRIHQIIEGTNEIMRLVIARDVLTNSNALTG